MSPTVLRHGPYRFFFFSREEARMHVHIRSAEGEAKFWLEPTVALADYTGFNRKQLKELRELVGRNENVIRDAWENILEILDISQHGVWLYWNAQEHFLPYEHFPWFKEAKVKEILNVAEEASKHLHWPDLDVDLSLDMIREPEKYPLVSK